MAIGTIAGAATYALFTSSATNEANAFTSGTLQVSSVRDDVPNIGPMFYTNTNRAPGTLPTGVWAPGDSRTRGLFLRNTGSLEAKLKTLSAKSADPTGNEVVSGADYASDIAFANHAHLKIWQLNWYDSDQGVLAWGKLNGTDLDGIMQLVNDGYSQWAEANPNADPSQDPRALDTLMETVNRQLLQKINNIRANIPNGGVYKNAIIKVTKMVDAPLSNIVNQDLNMSNFPISTQPGEAQLLAFTVTMDKASGNDMQGVSGYFNFNSYWEQAKNN
jgi:hypothetical protein